MPKYVYSGDPGQGYSVWECLTMPDGFVNICMIAHFISVSDAKHYIEIFSKLGDR